MKVSHLTGSFIYAKYLPLDQLNLALQYGDLISPLSSNKLIAFYKYSVGTYRLYAAIKFDDTTFVEDWFKSYATPNLVVANQNIPTSYIVDDAGGYAYAIQQLGTAGVLMNQIQLSDGMAVRYARVTDSTFSNLAKITSSLFLTDQILLPLYHITSPETLFLYSLLRSDLTLVLNKKITFGTSMDLMSLVVLAEGNYIYIAGGYSQFLFLVLNANNMTIRGQSLWKTSGFSYFYASGIGVTASSIFYFGYGIYTSQLSSVVFKTDTYGTPLEKCIPVDALQSGDGYIGVFGTFTSTLTITTLNGAVDGARPTNNLPLLADASHFLYRTLSYSHLQTDRDTWGNEVITTAMRPYQYGAQDCSMIAVRSASFPNTPTTWEFPLGTGVQTKVLTQVTSCQGRSQKLAVWSPYADNTTALQYTWVTWDQNLTISIDTDVVLYPITFHLRVRYYDELTPTINYFDHNIRIRLINATNITLTTPNCSPNNLFSMSLGGECSSGCEMYIRSFYVNDLDQNILVGGLANQGNINQTTDDLADAYVLRMSTMGYVEWYTSISSFSSLPEEVGAVTRTFSDYVYATYQTTQSSISQRSMTIIKLTYNEGKMIWARKTLWNSLFDLSSLYFVEGFELMPNPNYSSTMIYACVLQHPALGYILSYSQITDGVIQSNLQIKSPSNSGSMVYHGAVAHDGITSVYVSGTAYLSSGTYYDLFIAKLQHLELTVAWSLRFQDNLTYQPYTMASSVCYNNFTGSVYLAGSLSSYVMMVKLTSGGTIQIRVTINVYGYSMQQYGLVPDNANGNIYVLGIYHSYQAFIVRLDQNLANPSYTFVTHSSNRAYTHRFYYGTSQAIYIALNQYYHAFTTFSSNTMVFHKLEYFTGNSAGSSYECHNLEYFSGYGTVVQSYSLSASAIPASSMIQTAENFLTVDNTLIRTYQLQEYGKNKMYPGSDNYYKKYKTGTTDYPCSYNGIQYPTVNIQFPTEIELVIGDTTSLSYNLSTDFEQCQDVRIRVWIVDELNMFTRNSLNNWITVNDSHIEIDTTYPGITPGFRMLRIDVCPDSVLTKCRKNYLTLTIWPLTMTNATTTVQTTTCTGIQYPKVFGASNANYQSYLISSDLDQSNGNMLMCGHTGLAFYGTVQYNFNRRSQVIITLLDTIGKPMWAYNMQYFISNASYPHIYVKDCIFGFSSDIYSLIYFYGNSNQQMFLVRQNYERGKVMFISEIVGVIDYNYAAKIQQHPTTKSIYFTGKRIDFVPMNFYLAKINPSSSYATHMWGAYTGYVGGYQNNDYNTKGHSVSTFSDSVFTVSYVYIYQHGQFFMQLSKHSGSTGAHLITKHGPAFQYTIPPKIAAVTDSAGYVYVSYGQYIQADTANPQTQLYLSKWTDGLTKQAGIYLYWVVVASTANFDHDIKIAGSYVYVILSQGSDFLTITVHQKSDLSIYQQRRFQIGSAQFYNPKIHIYGSSIFYTFSSLYVLTSYSAGVINKVNLDFTNPESCMPMPAVGLNSAWESVDQSYASSYLVFSTNSSSYVMNSTAGIYGELITESQNTFAFSSATTYSGSCQIINPPQILTQYDNQFITLPSSGSTYTFTWPTTCDQSALALTWWVDKYTTVPTFISMTHALTSSTISMNPIATDVGTYTIRLRFYVVASPTIYSETTFLVDVYPAVPYGTTTLASCGSVTWPAFLKSSTDSTVTINGFDVDSTESNYIVCGQQTSVNSLNTSIKSSFVQMYNKNWVMHYHQTFEVGNYSSLGGACLFGESGYTYTLLNQIATSGGFFSTVNFFKHQTVTGKLTQAKQMANPSGQFIADHYFVLTNGTQYVMGRSSSTVFQPNTNSHMFYMRIDPNLALQTFKTLLFGGNFEARRMVIDTVSLDVYVNVYSYYNSAGCFGLTKLYTSSGSHQWTKLLTTSYIDARGWQQGIAYYSSAIYHFSTKFITHPSYSNGWEAHLHKFDVNGAITQAIEFRMPNEPLNTDLFYATAVSKIIALVSYTSYLEILLFNAPSITMVAKTLKYYYSGIMFDRSSLQWVNSKLWIFNRATLSGNTGQYGVISRIVDFTTFTLLENCTFSGFYQEDITAGTQSFYAVANNGIFDNHSTYYITPSGLISTTVSTTIISQYWTNPYLLKAQYFTAATADLKSNYGQCSAYSSPTLPVVYNRTGNVTGTNIGGFKVGQSYNLVMNPFTQCQGVAFTVGAIQASQAALPSTIVFNSASRTFVISPTMNSQAGNYTLRYFANITAAPLVSNYTDFLLEILLNEPPYLLQTYNNTVTMFAWHNFSWTLELETDLENDIASFTAQIETSANVVISPQPSWFQISLSDSQQITIDVVQPSQPVTGTNQTLYYIRVKSSDQYNTATPRSDLISLTVKRNFAPTMTQVLNQSLGTIYVTQSFAKTFWYQNFTDAEGDDVIIACSTNTTTTTIGSNWVLQEQNLTDVGNVTLYGETPANNQYEGLYVIHCNVDDQYDAPPNVYDFSLTVIPKPVVVTSGNPGPQSQMLPFNQTIDMSQYNYDQIGYQYGAQLYVNNTLYDSSTIMSQWLHWDDISQNLTVTAFNNSQGGNHSICVKYADGVSTPQYINFTWEVKFNFGLRALQTISTKGAIVDNTFVFHFNKTELFQDPENNTYMMYIRQAESGNILPYFISKNFSNGTIAGFVTDSDVGSYNLECVGVDDSFQETIIPFILIVKPCYYKCLKCWESDYNTCLSCKTDFFLYGSECLEQCIVGTYADLPTQKCLPCPTECKTCFGNSSTSQCYTCLPGFYKLSFGCYSKCPIGYWGDTQDYSCKLCNKACTDCFGPSTQQCTKCSEVFGKTELSEIERVGYLRVKTECRIPKCIDGQYFEWVQIGDEWTGQCNNCDKSCKKCTGKLSTQCTLCPSGSIYDSDIHTCTKCEEITGLFTNEELECEDICGDGIIVFKECDDGNSISGDGCSNQCKIEYGFGCPIANFTCKEIISPEFKIELITEINLIYVKFTEPIYLASENAISLDNLQVQIIGSKSSYDFKWRIIEDPNNLLVPDRKIEKFQIKLSDILSSLDGSEQVRLSFKNSSEIYDAANNTIVNGSYSEINPYPFIYVSAGEASAVNGTGTSLKYTFISVFSFNIGLKVIMNSSMQYLWGLVHALQVFNFLLLLNIELPANVESFAGYLSIASGDIQEFNQFIPSMSSYLISEDDIVDQYDNENLKQKFIDREIPPYFIMAFGQKLTMWAVGFLLVLPVALLMHKLCKKVQFWEEMINSFFFNAPLRTFIEMYIELVLQVVINTEFIKFSNFSQIVATSFVFIFGALSLLLPFLTMSLIYEGRKLVRKQSWNKRFGMLTEELRGRSILQLYYYPLFMYQRLMIAGIIVYVYNYPFLQCLMVIGCNIAMIAYLIVVRPFKEENLQTTTVLDEFVIMLCVCLFLILHLKELSPDEKKGVGWGIIMLILFSVIKNFGVVIYFGFLTSRQRLREMFSAEDEMKDSPNTSNDDSASIDSINSEDAYEEIRKDQETQKWNDDLPSRNKNAIQNQQKEIDLSQSFSQIQTQPFISTKHQMNIPGYSP